MKIKTMKTNSENCETILNNNEINHFKMRKTTKNTHI